MVYREERACKEQRAKLREPQRAKSREQTAREESRLLTQQSAES
jgi:hypothetical protein